MTDQYQQTKAAYLSDAPKLAQYWSTSSRANHIKLALSLAVANPAILELGCGPGRDAAILAPLCSSYTGIDYAAGLIDLAKVKVPSGNFIVGDMLSTSFPPGIDLIIAFASLIHLNQKQFKRVLDKASHSLKPGGIFYISVKAGSGTTVATDEFGTRTFYLYQPEDIAKMAQPDFQMIHKEIDHHRNHDWAEVVLQKN